MSKQEIYYRLLEIHKQGKETGCYDSSIFNLILDIEFDIFKGINERSEENGYKNKKK